MPKVHIPAQLKNICGDCQVIEIEGRTILDIIEALERRFHGVKDYLLEGGELRSSIAVWIDGEPAPGGLLEHVQPNSEVHFLPALGGG